MAQMTLPAEPAYKRTSYSGLLGADFSVDPSLVDKKHSPDLLNMISDNGGNPVKRTGWEIVNDHEAGEVTNLWTYIDTDGTTNYRMIAYTVDDNGASTLYVRSEDGTKTLTQAMASTGKHVGFYTNINDDQHGFYVMDGTAYRRIYMDTTGALVHENVTPYVPTVIIGRSPTGGGVVLEDVNMLTSYRKEQFLNTSTGKSFKVTTPTDENKIRSVKYKTSDGWEEDTSYSVGSDNMTITLSTAHAPVVTGEDNIIIEYRPLSGTAKATEVLGCTIMARFSATAQDQVFVSGNQKKKNYVYYCSPNDISYWPDLNYMNIGGDTEIMGFLNLGEYLAIVKEPTSYDSTIYMVYQTSFKTQAVTTTSNNTSRTETETIRTFAVRRATSGMGAISNYAFGVINDEPLFLSPNGIYGIVSANLTSEKIVRNRSYYLDARLTKEPNLKNAVSCVWNNYYICVVNGHAYILDGRHKSTDYSGNTNYHYEAYYWDNIPAVCMVAYGKEMWFGTADGKICRFKNSGGPTDYSDGTVKDDETVEGVPIVATWSTPNDNDGFTEYFKKMMKKGTMCTVAPFDESSVNVYIRVDSYPRQYLGTWFVDIGDMFNSVKFDRLSFDTRTGPRDAFFKKKQKKYIRLQIILENNKINEPFGIYEIVKTYVLQRYAKGQRPYMANAEELNAPTWNTEE